MAIEHIKQVLTNSGIDDADFEIINALPADHKDFKADDYVGKARTSFETQIKNDPKFWEGLDENNVNDTLKKKIEAQQYGRASNIVRQKTLKAFGLSEDDFADLAEEDKKKFEVFIGKAADKYAATKAGDKQLQKDLVDARKRIEEFETKIPADNEALKADYEGKLNNEKLDFIVLAELASVQGLKVPANYIADKVAAELKNNYSLKVNGLKADVKQKENAALDVLEGSKILGLKDLITKILIRDGLIAEGQKPETSSGKTTIEVEGKDGELQVSSHILDKIAEVRGKES